MPADFERCKENGGKIITVNPTKDTYMAVCYPKGGGSPVRGEVHRKKKK